MTKHLCACSCLEKVAGFYYCSNPLAPHNKNSTRLMIGSEKKNPTWCPLKIKYRFNYHIVRNSHGIYPRNRQTN